MTDSTETAWMVDGVSLQTFARNVQSLAPKYGTPQLRGTDPTVAYRRGAVWRPKIADVRTEQLGMWITATDDDGALTAKGMERQFHQNMVALQNLLWTDGERQVTLTKKWKDPLTGDVVTATALAEPQGFTPEMRGPYSAVGVAEFVLTEPYYYGVAQTVAFAVGVPQDVVVLGDVRTNRITMDANGQLSNGTLTNSTPVPENWLRVGSSIAGGDKISLDVDNFIATRESDGANMIGAVSRSGGRYWMNLWPGSNTLVLTADSGTGTVDLTYAPAYM